MSRPASESGSDGYSFHNVCPRSRNERRALGDKDSLEKARLAQREGKEWDDEEQARRLNPVKPLQDSLSFATESERFSTDVAAQDAERRSRERESQKVRDACPFSRQTHDTDEFLSLFGWLFHARLLGANKRTESLPTSSRRTDDWSPLG